MEQATAAAACKSLQARGGWGGDGESSRLGPRGCCDEKGAAQQRRDLGGMAWHGWGRRLAVVECARDVGARGRTVRVGELHTANSHSRPAGAALRTAECRTGNRGVAMHRRGRAR